MKFPISLASIRLDFLNFIFVVVVCGTGPPAVDDVAAWRYTGAEFPSDTSDATPTRADGWKQQ